MFLHSYRMVVVDTNANCTKFQIWKNSFDMMDFLVTNILLNHYLFQRQGSIGDVADGSDDDVDDDGD